MNSTSTQRRLYAPACSGKGNLFIDALRALDRCYKAWNYHPKSGQTWGYNCRKITGGSGHSLHAYGPGAIFVFWTGVRITSALASDTNSLANPYGPRLVTDMPRQMVEAILAIRTNSGARLFGWGGNYRNNKDAMHWEIVCDPADLRSGINWNTVAGSATPISGPKEDPDMNIDMESVPPKGTVDKNGKELNRITKSIDSPAQCEHGWWTHVSVTPAGPAGRKSAFNIWVEGTHGQGWPGNVKDALGNRRYAWRVPTGTTMIHFENLDPDLPTGVTIATVRHP